MESSISQFDDLLELHRGRYSVVWSARRKKDPAKRLVCIKAGMMAAAWGRTARELLRRCGQQRRQRALLAAADSPRVADRSTGLF